MKRDWSAARAKVEAEGRCRACKRLGRVEAAHVIGRASDARTGALRVVHQDSVIPLCSTCHYEYDAHERDVLPLLTLDEQVQAVRDAGGLELARVRTAPLAYKVAA